MRPDNSKVTVIRMSILFTLYDAEFGDLRGEKLEIEVPNYCWCHAHCGAIVAILAVAVMFTLSQVGWQEIRLSYIFLTFAKTSRGAWRKQKQALNCVL